MRNLMWQIRVSRRGARRLGSLAAVIVVMLALTQCNQTTGRLTAEQEQRLQAEGVVRRADDLVFRYTHGAGTRTAGWEDRKASIIVTKQRVIIHKNEKLGLDLSPRTRRFAQVRRDGDRVRISAGGGQSAESWSFVPPGDPSGWARDIRTVVSLSQARPR
jgi:hypothetical protein